MSRKLVLLIGILLVFSIASFGLIGCDEEVAPIEADPDDPLADLPEIEITYAHTEVADPTQNMQAAALAFKDYVEERSGGKITVNVSPAGELGDTASLQEMTMTGEIEIAAAVTEGTVALAYPNIQVCAIPYLFDSIDIALEVFRGEFGQEMFEDMRQQTGLRVISVWDNGGFRHFTNSVREVRSPEDIEGLRIRTMDIPAHMAIVENLGASPTPISWAELYTALETGVVDGQENAIPVVIIGSVYEVQDYMTLDGHVYSQTHTIANDDWFNDLPVLYQQIILDGGEKAGFVGEKYVRAYRDHGLAYLSRYMEIYEPTPEEIELFRVATQEPVLEFIREDLDEPEWVDRVLEAVQEAREQLGYER